MSYVFGKIDKSSTIIENNIVNYTQNLTTASAGIKTFQIVSGSISQSYWESLNVMFYTSGSPTYGNETKFTSPANNIISKFSGKKQFLSKYHGYPSSSLITIPSQYYGEQIREESFKFVDLNNTDNSGINPIIRDDGNGNLYSTNAHHTQSNESISSSDNYVGNIFYDKGLAVITETGSWSGSVKYSDLVNNYSMSFDSINTITTHEYNVTLQPEEYNLTTNYTLRGKLSGSKKDFSLSTSNVASKFRSGSFQPYITHINLYQDGDFNDGPIIQATLPKPIRKSDKINMRFKIKLDI